MIKRVVITGADGFIGSHLVRRLLPENIEIWAVVLPDSATISRLDGLDVHIEQCELNDLKGIPENIDVFYHFAWQGVAPCFRDDFDMQYKNIEYCIDCVRFAAKVNARKFVFPGSTTEYLYHRGLINEEAVPSKVNAYSSAKLASRFLCEMLANNLKIDFIYTVITGIYAADRRDNNVIFYTISELLNGRKPKLTSLEQSWNYVHIDDVTEALYLIGEKGRGGGFYSIGSNENMPLHNYITKIRDLINPSLPLGIGEIPNRTGKLPSSCIDLTAITNDTGFFPAIPFSEGITKVIESIEEEMQWQQKLYFQP